MLSVPVRNLVDLTLLLTIACAGTDCADCLICCVLHETTTIETTRNNQRRLKFNIGNETEKDLETVWELIKMTCCKY